MGLEGVHVKAAMVEDQEQGSGRLTTVDGFGGGLGAGAMAAQGELGIPSALPYITLRSVD